MILGGPQALQNFHRGRHRVTRVIYTTQVVRVRERRSRSRIIAFSLGGRQSRPPSEKHMFLGGTQSLQTSHEYAGGVTCAIYGSRSVWMEQNLQMLRLLRQEGD